MVWHIFRKDFKLLWKAVCGVAALYVLRLVVESMHVDPLAHGSLSGILRMLSLLAPGLLVVMVVQRDAIPGLRQDWLVRPIRRSDLLLSKVAFVVLLIQCPLVMFDLCEGLATGFPLGLALQSSLAGNAEMLFIYLLPALAFATLAGKLTEALLRAFAIGFTVLVFMTSIASQNQTMNSTIWWIPASIETISTLIGAAIILGLQYYARKTVTSRWICAVTVLIGLMVQLMPWNMAFAIQERFSAQPDAAKRVQIAFGKSTGRTPVVTDAGLLVRLSVPLSITGVQPDETLFGDRVESRIVNKDGIGFGLGPTTVRGSSLDFDRRVLWVTMPRETLDNGTARLDLDGSLTLYRMTAHQTMPLNGARLLDDIGMCTSETDIPVTQVRVDCRFAAAPALTKWSLGSTSSIWQRSYPVRFGASLGHSYVGLPFVSPGDRDASLEMRAYEPLAHFNRHLSIPISDLR